MNGDELLLIAQQATYLSERLAGEWIPRQEAAPQRAAQARLERWCHLAAGGDWVRFGKRLAWDGLDLDGARRLLTDGYLADWTEAPAWTEIVAEADEKQLYVGHDSGVTSPSSRRSRDLRIVQPFLAVAQRRLQQMAGATLLWLAPLAQARLTASLQQQLCQAVTPTLELTGWQSLSTLSHSYPLLARQLATQVMQWVDASIEFLQRLATDWPLLVAYSGRDIALVPGVISDLQPALSDRHAGGRTVWAITIGDRHHPAATLAYKPKDLTMDRAWNDLLAWCNAQGVSPQLLPLWTLPRTGYGWMAWATPQPAPPADQARYYQRVGMLLGLLHLLHATDCHAENLVTQGDQLFLVDAEMLPYPQIGGLAQADPLDVMRTGLLPRWQISQQSVAELGGITAGRQLERAEGDALLAGYHNLYEFLVRHWHELDAPSGPLASFRQGRVRFAPRPTAAYLRLLEYLRHPTFLQRGVDFSIGVDQLARTYLTRPDHEGFWPLLAVEHASFNQGDVPSFTLPVGQAKLTGGTQPIELALRWPPFTLPTPLAHQQQAQLIAASLDCDPYLPGAPSVASSGESGNVRYGNHTDVPADSFRTWAVHLGDLLMQRAVPLANGGLGWIANQQQPRSGLHQLGLVDDGLYSGRAGIALFLAALYRATDDEQWRQAALAGFRGCQEKAAACHAALADVGGRLYALSQAAALLGAPELLMAAIALSPQSNERQNDTSQALTWGVLDGQAGLLLGLLALHHQLTVINHPASASILARAIACGDGLIASQAEWLDDRQGLGGFSHGVAGIGYALAALVVVSGESRFQNGAEAGWAMQARLYANPPGNWQDRRGATPVYLDNWCNGAAGIGLAAVGSVQILPPLTRIVERAATLLIENTSSAALDTLCCGRWGQIESLLEMGLILERPAWIAQAVQLAQEAMRAAASTGHFRLYDDLPSHLFNPTFFRGVAGIGYTLLRLAAVTGERRAMLPCVLRWAPRNENLITYPFEIERLRDSYL